VAVGVGAPEREDPTTRGRDADHEERMQEPDGNGLTKNLFGRSADRDRQQARRQHHCHPTIAPAQCRNVAWRRDASRATGHHDARAEHRGERHAEDKDDARPIDRVGRSVASRNGVTRLSSASIESRSLKLKCASQYVKCSSSLEAASRCASSMALQRNATSARCHCGALVLAQQIGQDIAWGVFGSLQWGRRHAVVR
jgi:hypothetical protein